MAENLNDLAKQLNAVAKTFAQKMEDLGNIVPNSTKSKSQIVLNNKPATLIQLADGNALIQFTDPTEGDFEQLKAKLS